MKIFFEIEIFWFWSLPPYTIPGTIPFALRALTSPLDFVFLIVASIEFIKTKFFNLCSLITQENYLNKSETDVEFEILLIASPIKFDIVKTSIF